MAFLFDVLTLCQASVKEAGADFQFELCPCRCQVMNGVTCFLWQVWKIKEKIPQSQNLSFFLSSFLSLFLSFLSFLFPPLPFLSLCQLVATVGTNEAGSDRKFRLRCKLQKLVAPQQWISDVSHLYFQIKVKKPCQNNMSGRGSLEVNYCSYIYIIYTIIVDVSLSGSLPVCPFLLSFLIALVFSFCRFCSLKWCQIKTKKRKIAKDWRLLGFATNTLGRSQTFFSTIATTPKLNTWLVPGVYPFGNQLGCEKNKLGWAALIFPFVKK